MRKASVVVLALVVLSSFSLLYAQQKAARQISRSSIELAGVKLQLGMSKADVAERFVGTQITKENEETWLIGNVGTVRFKNEKLIYADRSWMNGEADDQIGAIFKAVASLNRQGLSVCKISADTPGAGITSERIWIDCGQKAIRIIKIKFPNNSYTNVEVSETLGEFDVDSRIRQ